jgi:DNA anti-recombination protein RmuC
MIQDDDPTQSLPDEDLTTQPTAMAILERLRQFESRLSQSVQQLRSSLENQIASLRDEMNTRFAEAREEMNTRFLENREEMNARFLENREEMNTHFRLVANKIEVMHEDNLNVRAGQRELLK